MKVLRFGIDDDIHDELQSTADNKEMSVVSLMAYVIGTFLWIIRHATKDHMIVALDEGGEVVGVLDIWKDDENGA